jgi:hypothetical protein
MSNTLVQWEQASTDELIRGVAKSIYLVSPWLQNLPFATINGNAHKYNLQLTGAGADFYDVNDPWLEQTGTWETRYADLAILGGDADVDNFAASTSQQDLESMTLEQKGWAVADRFNLSAILGGTTASPLYNSPKVFKGLTKLIAECETITTTDLDSANNSQVVKASDTSAALTLANIYELIDAVKPYPAFLAMSLRTRRKLASLAQATGNNLTVGTGALGLPVEMWGRHQIWADDAIPDNIQDGAAGAINMAAYVPTTARGAGNDNSLIFAFRLGDGALRGITSRENGMVQVEAINRGGSLEGKDAKRHRVKFYCGMELLSKRAAAVLINFTDS